MEKDLVLQKFNETNINNFKNKGLFYGEFLGQEEDGVFNNMEYTLVLMKTARDNNKPLFIWVALPKTRETKEFITKNTGKKVLVEGYICVTYNFNDKAVSHTFIVPEILEEVDEVILDNHEDFYMSYTMGNRVIIEGKILEGIWIEHIPTVNKDVTRFLMEIDVKGKKRNVYCSMWDTINNIEELKSGLEVCVIGSYAMLKKERGLVIKDGIVVESRKNKLDSYVVMVQKIELINDENK